MSKITILEGNSNDRDNTRNFMVKGERGYSAYELYVQNGGTLTEEEWLDEFLNADNFYNKSEVKGLVIDNLNSNLTDQPLSAKQGKVLDGSKVNTSDIVDNLTSNDASKVLSAKQGKALNEAKVNITDIVDNVTSNDTNKPLSAKQGKVLNDSITNLAATLSNDYVPNENFALIERTVTLTANTSENVAANKVTFTDDIIDYPTDFDAYNSVVVSVGRLGSNSYSYGYGWDTVISANDIIRGIVPTRVNLYNENATTNANKIVVSLGNFSTDEVSVTYRVVLMKFSPVG